VSGGVSEWCGEGGGGMYDILDKQLTVLYVP